MKVPFAILTVLVLSLPLTVWSAVKLPLIFQNHMVLQRGKPIQVWGWADPKESVEVKLNGQTVATTADKNGKWRVQLPVMEAGGPYDFSVQGKNTITLTDVMIGDVWICSGQSNMQWQISQTGYQEKDSALLKQAHIRLFTVQIDTDYMPREDIKGGEWKTLSVDNVNSFSAVAYHFGKYLYKELNVPIGLISDNLGATSVEAWMSNEALLEFPQFESLVGPVVKARKSFAQLEAAFEKSKVTFYKQYLAGLGFQQGWFKPDFDVSGWKTMEASGNTWENQEDLQNYDGAVWFRKTFDLPDNFEGDKLPIFLGQIDDHDIVWVNGQKIGETYGRHNHRNYTIPGELLKKKGNVLVVRVVDVGGIGGFTTASFWGNPIMWGNWHYQKDESLDIKKLKVPDLPNATPFSSPAVLYNGCIAPLTSLSIKGAIWYQGESNAERAYEYRQLFPRMINDWRQQWKQGNFPFLFVQLANYEAESPEPGQSTWAELREAQSMTLSLPNTGMATAIDVGEANDIHPKNKEAVGIRLGLAALKVAYGKSVVHSGPTFKSMKLENGKALIEFENVGSGIITKDKYGYVRGFQVAGADKKFYWAKAYLDGSRVVVNCPEVKEPIAVRYAWDNNPGPLDLYNREGLPAVPFRTDNWEGVTAGKVFVDGPRF